MLSRTALKKYFSGRTSDERARQQRSARHKQRQNNQPRRDARCPCWVVLDSRSA